MISFNYAVENNQVTKDFISGRMYQKDNPNMVVPFSYDWDKVLFLDKHIEGRFTINLFMPRFPLIAHGIIMIYALCMFFFGWGLSWLLVFPAFFSSMDLLWTSLPYRLVMVKGLRKAGYTGPIKFKSLRGA